MRLDRTPNHDYQDPVSLVVNNLKFFIKHRTKLALAMLIRFVVARPRLLAFGLLLGNRLPQVKRFLTRVHLTTRPDPAAALPAVEIPTTVPPVARSVYLQLTHGQPEN